MRKFASLLLPGLLLAFGSIVAAVAAEPTPTPKGASSPGAVATADSNLLKGTWVRPDGGYTILIKSVGANGQIEAMYFNPTEV